MADLGFKIGKKGIKLEGDKKALDLIVSSTYPNLKCWMRPKPRHYGTFTVHIRNLTNGQADLNLLIVKHGYGFKPAFMAAWSCPQGSTNTRNTYGVGNYDAFSPYSFTITPRVDATNFYIALVGVGGSGATTPLDITFRYYIFGDEFKEGQTSNI